jgi:hypothetical protein
MTYWRSRTGILREDLWRTLKIYLFSWKMVTFSALAAIWSILEHLYSEMVAEPPCNRGFMHMLSLLQIPHDSFFTWGTKVPFESLLKNRG